MVAFVPAWFRPSMTLWFRPLGLAAVLVFVLAAVGCDSSNVLGGVWRATLPAGGDPIIGADMPAGSTVGVELILGHYGPDVTGLIKFYRNDAYDLPRQSATPSRQCACTFVREGRWSATARRLNFVVRGCLPGAATEKTVYVRGAFTLDAAGILSGTLEVEDPASDLVGRKQSWEFERVESVSRSDLLCETEDDADAGNTASGR